jgi:hypothetical protein
MLKQLDPGKKIEQAVLDDFNTYSITGIDRVIVDTNIAFVEAKITYHPDKLADVIADEKDNAGNNVDGASWGDMGGSSSSAKYEKGGAGLATYYMVLQKGAWKIHETYFSLEPMTDNELRRVGESMKTLVQ